jgi:hypothetical protein
MPDHPYEVVEVFPSRGPYQLHRLKQIATCSYLRCGGPHRARLVAVVSGNWFTLLCNNCYQTLNKRLPPDQLDK